MKKFLLRTIFVLLAATALGGWADRRGLLQPIWDAVCPAHVASGGDLSVDAGGSE